MVYSARSCGAASPLSVLARDCPSAAGAGARSLCLRRSGGRRGSPARRRLRWDGSGGTQLGQCRRGVDLLSHHRLPEHGQPADDDRAVGLREPIHRRGCGTQAQGLARARRPVVAVRRRGVEHAPLSLAVGYPAPRRGPPDRRRRRRRARAVLPPGHSGPLGASRRADCRVEGQWRRHLPAAHSPAPAWPKWSTAEWQ